MVSILNFRLEADDERNRAGIGAAEFIDMGMCTKGGGCGDIETLNCKVGQTVWPAFKMDFLPRRI